MQVWTNVMYSQQDDDLQGIFCAGSDVFSLHAKQQKLIAGNFQALTPLIYWKSRHSYILETIHLYGWQIKP